MIWGTGEGVDLSALFPGILLVVWVVGRGYEVGDEASWVEGHGAAIQSGRG